jgi:LacI family transcriptional regulator
MSANSKKRNGRATIYEVAAEACVSLATVSRVINGTGNVNDETRMLVEKAIDKLGYVPSNIARGLAKSKTTNVAIVLPSPNYNYINNIMAGMFEVCKIYGYSPSVFTYEGIEDVSFVLDNVISSRVDGIVLFNSQLSKEDLAKLSRNSLPMVIIGNDVFQQSNGLVDICWSETLKKVLQKRIEKGVKEIYFLKDHHKDWHMTNMFENACIEAVEGTDCKFETIWISDSYGVIYEHFKDQFAFEAPNHELYVTSRDSLACAINNAAIDLGFKVPDDLETLGVVGTKQASMSRPTISTIDVDLFEVGSISMRMLTKLIKDNLDKKTFIFKTHYKKRNSTKS